MMFSLLMVIAVYDLKHKIIPDTLSLVFGVLAFIGIFFFTAFGLNPHIPSILDILAGAIVSVPLALLWLFSRGAWMGLGDAKLSVGLGFLLGFYGALSGVVIAFWSGAIVGLVLIIFSKKYGMKSEVPFAPFLILGVLLVFLFGIHLFPMGF